MALEWVNKVNGVDENDADDVNTLAAAIKENETAIAGKVDKEAGKQLSSNDYTTEEKNKLAGIEAGANNYAHPATHPASMIEGLGDAAVKNTGTTAGTVAAGDHNHDGTYQPTGNYLTSEGDPTVPAWAKAATKPTYTAAEVGADASGAASAVQTNLDTHTGNTANPHSVTKDQVGLGNVDNTSDLDKPISTAAQAALNGKSNTDHNHDGVYLKPSNILAGANVSISTSGNDVTISSIGGGGGDIPLINNLTTDTPGQGALDAAQGKILNDGKADVNHTHTKEQVGLSNVDNTSDADKPVSTATQTALNGKSNTDHNHAGVYQPVGSYLTSETDPTVPAWAKAATKPAYTAAEVGADAAGSAAAVQTNLTSHTGNQNNPHNVTAAQVGAAASVHYHSASNITSGTLSITRGGTGVTSVGGTDYTTTRFRGSQLRSADTTPTTNGTINWTYE